MAVTSKTGKLGLRARLSANSGIVGKSVRITNPAYAPRGRNLKTKGLGMGATSGQQGV